MNTSTGLGDRMTRFFPASTNGDYHGNPIAAIALTLLAVLTIAPGCIHAFLPDGGAGVIAGLDLSQNGTTIIGVFAWVGATQIVWGSLMLLVSLAYRSFVPLFLALILIERTIIALNQWIFKPGEGAHHPPEAYATLAAIPIVLLMLALSLRRRGNSRGEGRGGVLAGAGLEATSFPARLFFQLLNGPTELNLDAQMRFSLAVLGAVTMGWSVTLWAAIRAANQLGERGRPIWALVTASALTWFVIDTPLSIATGYGLNAIPNVVFLATFLLPVIRSGVLKRP